MQSGEQGTVIGKSLKIRGELTGSDDLFIDGDVEGTITVQNSKLTIGPSGKVRANVAARDVVVVGTLDGNVKAIARVELRQGARVLGDIAASRLSIEDSAMLKGKVELTQSAPPASRPAPPPPPVAVMEEPQLAKAGIA